VSLVSAVGTAPDSADTLAYWATEDLTDSSPSGFDFTNYGATSGVTGIIDTTFENNDDFSVSFWIKTTETSFNQLISKFDNSAVRGWDIVMTPVIYFELYSSSPSNRLSVASSTSINDGNFHHVVITYDGSTDASGVKIYIDGVSDSLTIDKDSLSSTTITTADFRIGNRDGRSEYFTGSMDEIFIFNGTLSQNNVDYLYNSGSPSSSQQYPFSASGSSSFDVTAIDVYDDSSINSFWAYIDGTNYSTTNGTIHTDLFQNDTSLYTLQVGASDYFAESYSDVDVSSNYEAVLHQSEISFDSFEFITTNTLSNVTYTIDGQENTTFYLSEGSYVVLVEPAGYYAQNYSFNVTPLDNLTIDINGFYNNVLTLNLKDVITTDLIEYTSYVVVNNNDGFNQSYSNSNGTLNIDLIQDNYSLTLWADNYAFKYVNVTLDNLTESFDYSLYSNNSLWVTALDQNTGSTLLNFSVEVFDANNSYVSDSNNTGIVRLNNITSGVYTLRVDTDGYSVAEYALTMTGGSHQAVVAYLVASGSDAIFTIVDSISSGIIEGASINMYKTIGPVWTLVSSQESDITGRVQFTYIPNVEYRFIIDADGYELRTFFLKPLFTSYTIRLTPDVVSVPDLNTGSYIYSINNSGLFYDDQNNSFEVSITSGTGTIEYYNLTATNFDGSIYSESCIVASGCSDPFIFEITGANFADVVSVEYWIKESGRSEKYFKKVYHVQDIYDPSTLEGWKDVDDDDVDSLTKAFTVMIICLIVVGFVSVGSIMVGVPPVTVSGVVLAVLVEVFAYVGFIPNLAGHLIALGCILILIFGRGEI
jgi:hypothetical protein